MYQLLSEQECQKGIELLEQLLETPTNDEDINAISKKLTALADVKGFTAKLMASCEYLKKMNKAPYFDVLYTLSVEMSKAVTRNVITYQSLINKLKQDRDLARYGS